MTHDRIHKLQSLDFDFKIVSLKIARREIYGFLKGREYLLNELNAHSRVQEIRRKEWVSKEQGRSYKASSYIVMIMMVEGMTKMMLMMMRRWMVYCVRDGNIFEIK
jgi:hypothetical protein